jgi:hypothetical protein
MKKNLVTYALIAGGVVAAVLIIRKMNKDKKRRSTVTADSPIIQTEEQFYVDREQAEKPSPIETVTNIFKTVFPKKTAEQKAAKKSARLAKRTARKAKKQVSGVVDSVVY